MGSEIAIFDEFPSPAITDGAGSSAPSGQSQQRGKQAKGASRKSKSSKTPSTKKRKAAQSSTPRAARSSGGKTKPKVSRVSVPVKTVMVNITNSAGSEKSDLSGTVRKKRYSKKAPKKTAKDDDLDFAMKDDDLGFSSDSPHKPEVKLKA